MRVRHLRLWWWEATIGLAAPALLLLLFYSCSPTILLSCSPTPALLLSCSPTAVSMSPPRGPTDHAGEDIFLSQAEIYSIDWECDGRLPDLPFSRKGMVGGMLLLLLLFLLLLLLLLLLLA